jgi:hypothetical protein
MADTPKTTAIDWLISKLPKLPPDIIPDEEWFGIIGEAREMEREQIEQAYGDGLNAYRTDFCNRTMYYDKTYGKSE